MPYEMIITSVPRGLDGGSGFQAVRRTKGMSLALSERLQQRSGYTHQFAPGDERNPVIYSHRIERVAGEVYHVIAAIRDAGTDHSGRSNRLAHLIAFSQAEVQDFPVGPAELLHILRDQNIICKRWSGPPEQTAAPVFPRGNTTPRSPCIAWLKAGVEPAIAGELAEAAGRSTPVLILLKNSVDALALFGDASLLVSPSNRWQITFSTDAATAGQLTWTAAVGAQGQSLAASGRFELIDATAKRQPTPTPFTRFAAGESRELPWQTLSKTPAARARHDQSAVELSQRPATPATLSLPANPPNNRSLTPPSLAPTPPDAVRRSRSEIELSPRSARRRRPERTPPIQTNRVFPQMMIFGILAVVVCCLIFVIPTAVLNPSFFYKWSQGNLNGSFNPTKNIKLRTVQEKEILEIQQERKQASKTSPPKSPEHQQSAPVAESRKTEPPQMAEESPRKKKGEVDSETLEVQKQIFKGLPHTVALPQSSLSSELQIGRLRASPSTRITGINLSGYGDSEDPISIYLLQPPDSTFAVEKAGSSWAIYADGSAAYSKTKLLLIELKGSDLILEKAGNLSASSNRDYKLLSQCVLLLSANAGGMVIDHELVLYSPIEMPRLPLAVRDVRSTSIELPLPQHQKSMALLSDKIKIDLALIAEADITGVVDEKGVRRIPITFSFPKQWSGGKVGTRSASVDVLLYELRYGQDGKPIKFFLTLTIHEADFRLAFQPKVANEPGNWKQILEVGERYADDLKSNAARTKDAVDRWKKSEGLSSFPPILLGGLGTMVEIKNAFLNLRQGRLASYVSRAFSGLPDGNPKSLEEWERAILEEAEKIPDPRQAVNNVQRKNSEEKVIEFAKSIGKTGKILKDHIENLMYDELVKKVAIFENIRNDVKLAVKKVVLSYQSQSLQDGRQTEQVDIPLVVGADHQPTTSREEKDEQKLKPRY